MNETFPCMFALSICVYYDIYNSHSTATIRNLWQLKGVAVSSLLNKRLGTPEASVLNKCSCLAAALGVT